MNDIKNILKRRERKYGGGKGKTDFHYMERLVEERCRRK